MLPFGMWQIRLLDILIIASGIGSTALMVFVIFSL
jgi:hypothetical protein